MSSLVIGPLRGENQHNNLSLYQMLSKSHATARVVMEILPPFFVFVVVVTLHPQEGVTETSYVRTSDVPYCGEKFPFPDEKITYF